MWACLLVDVGAHCRRKGPSSAEEVILCIKTEFEVHLFEGFITRLYSSLANLIPLDWSGAVVRQLVQYH